MKTCKNKECQNTFNPVTSLQKYCFYCTVTKAKNKVWKVRKKELKEKIKTVSDYRADARYWFQRWIRLRDVGKTCISCKTVLKDIRDYDAGHYYNAKSYPQLLFNEFNVAGQCKYCNDFLSGNLIEYRKGIINRYGIDKLNELERLAEDKSVRTLTKEYYLEIADKYKKLCQQIEKTNKKVE